ncbi:interphotoreceptor retinoid-binding protein [Massilia varians]|uniref:Interphotoreceptor retinoid-binding protein n=1 Tax=Massilia varians TaxID=457921 RepID=A0ABN6TBP0_9BURK|nr:S41 family peptidase [Massilia varians]BDT58778.1 interphotoreceptor retinoid-binding protein [Massilia varians]
MKRIVSAIAVLLVLGVFWLAFKPRPDATVDAAMRSATIDNLLAKLNDHYVFPDKARQMQAVLRERAQAGRYDGIRNGYRLAQQLTTDLHGIGKDLHLQVRFAPGLDLTDQAEGPAPATQAQWEQRTHFFERLMMRHTAAREVKKVGRLGHNVGYLNMSSFPDAFPVADRLGAAMNELADTEGLIVDLRQNRGGDPQTVVLLISYFVDRPTRLNDIWDRASGTSVQHWTHDRLDGKRYGGTKPVMILVGPRTGSAAEDFAYTMQALKRATVVGERTWGGAHPTRFYRIGEHFFVQMPNQRSISPITGTNWEGTGVTPDIAATPDQALAVAGKLMRRRLQGGAPLVAAAP